MPSRLDSKEIVQWIGGGVWVGVGSVVGAGVEVDTTNMTGIAVSLATISTVGNASGLKDLLHAAKISEKTHKDKRKERWFGFMMFL